MLRAEPSAGDRGRSRFSKALPTPPSAPDASRPVDTTRPPSKQLPSVPLLPKLLARKPVRKPVLPTAAPLPEKPSPMSHSQPEPRHPPSSQLSPSQSARSTLPPPPPPMSIPRRPVVPAKTDATASLSTKTAPPTAEAPPASPTDSIGSLLSAYSRSSAGESIIRSSDGAGSQRYSAVTMSPQEEVRGGRKDGLTPLPSVPQEYEVPRGRLQESSRDLVLGKGLPSQPSVVDEGRKPFPPRKDSVRAPTADGPTTIMASSPQRDQLWRRRSGKSDRDIQMPELKLTNSHGSTAASQFPSHTSYAPEVPNKGPATNPLSHVSHANSHSHASAPAPAPAPVAGTEHAYSVTGTEHAYSHGDKTNVTPNSDDMGNEASKLKIKLSHLNPRDQRSVGSQQQGHGGLVSMSDSALDQVPRLPTPEYQMQDIRTPLVDGIVSPLSPAPSPHPPSEEQQAGPKPQAKPSIQRKAIGGRDLHSTKSLPQIRTEGPGITNAEPFPLALSTPIVAQGAIASPSSGHAAASGQPQSQPQPQLQPQQGFRPRTGSRSQEQRPVGLPLGPPALREKRSQASSLRSPHPGMQPSPESRTFPELRVEDLPPPNAAALRFPATVMTSAPAGTVFPALPIRPSMVDCHQKHRFINRSRQKNYAVACQTCHKADREDRWKCAACELRMCDGCFHFMNNHGRDLNKLADYLEAHPGDMAAPPTPVAMQHPARPGTGMSNYGSRPGTSMSQHGPRPGTAMSQRA